MHLKPLCGESRLFHISHQLKIDNKDIITYLHFKCRLLLDICMYSLIRYKLKYDLF